MQPCRNGAVARRGRKKRRPARVPDLRDANAMVCFSVGNGFRVRNDFAADARKTFGADAVRDAARPGVAAHAARLRCVPRADATESQPIGGRGPKGDGVEGEPSGSARALLSGVFGVRAWCVLRGACFHN